MSIFNSTLSEEFKKPVYLWDSKVGGFEEQAIQQIKNTASMDFVKGIAVMPDAHKGWGSTIGSVILTHKVIIPATVGVDIGCGMAAVQLSLKAADLPDNLKQLRAGIERRIPMGKNDNRNLRTDAKNKFVPLIKRLKEILEKYPALAKNYKNGFEKVSYQMSSLGGGNHFIEVCLDLEENVWIMLHSGSRNIGNRIGTYFTQLAQREMEKWMVHLPDKDLAYLPEGSEYYDDYIEAMLWAQDFAKQNRTVMMERVLEELKHSIPKKWKIVNKVVNCHHNYVEKENHLGKNVWVTRKGAIRARKEDLGIIPGAMGRKSFIVKGKGSLNSFCSCSHGAGRAMSRTAAKKKFTVDEHIKATEGLECLKSKSVLDETPAAYKNIDNVMASQTDLIEVVAELKAVVCCKGI